MKDSLPLIRRLVAYVRPYRRVVLLSVLAMAAAAAFEPVMPKLLAMLVDDGLIRKKDGAAWQVPLLLMATFTAKGLAEYVANVSSQWVAQRAIADLRQRVFDHQTALPMARHQVQADGAMLSRLLTDIPQIGQALSTSWLIVIRDSLIVLGLTGYLLWMSWQLTLLIVLIAPVVAWAIRSAGSKLRGSNATMLTFTARLTGRVQSALQGIREVKVFGARQWESERFHAVNEQLRQSTMRTIRVQAVNVPLVQVLAASAVSLVIFTATAMSSRNLLTAGGFVGFITAMSMLFEPIRRLTSVNGTIQAGLAAASGLFALLDEAPEPEGTGAPVAQPGRPQDLVFDALDFAYPGQDGLALAQFQLRVPAGSTVALVGASGSGKTTVTQLLTRFHAPTGGHIRWGRQDLADLELTAWRRELALVGQQVVLFDDTVAGNIAYGRPEVPREAIEAAARAAHAWGFIQQMPGGLDAPCGANGANLSGGQRQRIAIARAFLKDAPLLILDEATSALDNESERQVQLALQSLMKARTTLVIAHRLSTVEQADLIVVMERGRILEQGRHAELLAAGGVYERLYRAQFSEA